MKFILGKDGKSIVNAEQVQAVYIYEDSEQDEHGYFVPNGAFSVNVMICGQESRISLATFDGKDADENLTAAKKYLAELVAELNGGAQ